MSKLELTTAPGAAPISTSEAKTNMRVTHTSEDTLVDRLVKAATRAAEQYMGRSIITQTWTEYYDWLPSILTLHKGGLTAVNTFKYVDTSGVQQTLAANQYLADTKSHTNPPIICPAWGVSWPNVREQLNTVEIEFITGYGLAGTNVPDDILQALHLYIAHLFEHREAFIEGGNLPENPLGFEPLLFPHRVHF